MIQTQTRWKLGALLLLVPLALSVPTRADESEQDPITGHYDLRMSAQELPAFLKNIGTLRNVNGDVYVFQKNGQFEYRRGKKSAKGMTYLNDYGRFTVKPKGDTNNRPGGPKNDLVLKISTAKKQSSGQIIKRVDTRVLDIQAMTNPDELRNEKGSENDSVIYVLIDGKRFD